MTRYNYWTAALLGLSGMALSTLVPGGPIETRSFAHINPFTLGAFNTFLTTLCIGSLLLVYFVWQAERWAIIAAACFGLSYLGVYSLDLAQIFPVSPDAMPPALLIIEVWGAIAAVPLTLMAMQALRAANHETPATAPPVHLKTSPFSLISTTTIIGVILIGLGIIVFATRSAMGI
ncbi:MAG: hypothetical protein AAGD09_27285 [Cyanobacteria bacterium P01_F01_bin.56]